MSDAVIVGCISVIGSIIVQLIVSNQKSRENDARMAAHEQRQEDMVDNLNKQMAEVNRRLDAHNGYAEKFAESGKNLARIDERLKAIEKKVGV